MQTYYRFIIFTVIAVVACFSAHVATAWSAKLPNEKPHIVFVIADDMGWNDVSFHGADQIPTPNIDALAYNGVILNRHYALPTCTPSRTALLTGRYPIREGMQGYPLRAGEARGVPLNTILMPEYMRRLGYATRIVGKWHLGYLTEDHTPTRRGFDSFYGYYNGFISYFNHSIPQAFNGTSAIGHDLHRDIAGSLDVAYDSEYFTDLITDEAVKIINENGNDKPLFLKISHLAVHASETEDPLEVRNMTEVNSTFPYISDLKRRKYAGMLKAMDDSVGRVVTALEDAKMLENSIIIFIADNGAPTIGLYENTGSNYPLRGIKDTFYEGGVRSAACIFSPLIKRRSRVSNDYMSITDWLPTLYAAAGGNVYRDLSNIDGIDQWDVITRDLPSPRHSMLLNIDDARSYEAAILGKYKLIRDPKSATLYRGYYGETGIDPSYPRYEVEEALTSPAGLAISRLSKFTNPSITHLKDLRENATVRCDDKGNIRVNCTDTCLFDLYGDPCELTDLSKKRPDIVGTIESYLDDYREVMIPQRKPAGLVDPCALPRYFNGTWMPWRRKDIDYDALPIGSCIHPVDSSKQTPTIKSYIFFSFCI